MYMHQGSVNSHPHIVKAQATIDKVRTAILFREGKHQAYTELKTLFKLTHPNIVRARDMFRSEGGAGPVVEYFETSLGDYLVRRKKHPLTEKECL